MGNKGVLTHVQKVFAVRRKSAKKNQKKTEKEAAVFMAALEKELYDAAPEEEEEAEEAEVEEEGGQYVPIPLATGNTIEFDRWRELERRADAARVAAAAAGSTSTSGAETCKAAHRVVVCDFDDKKGELVRLVQVPPPPSMWCLRVAGCRMADYYR